MTWCCQATSNHLSQTYIPDHYDSLWHGLLCRLEFNSRCVSATSSIWELVIHIYSRRLSHHWLVIGHRQAVIQANVDIFSLICHKMLLDIISPQTGVFAFKEMILFITWGVDIILVHREIHNNAFISVRQIRTPRSTYHNACSRQTFIIYPNVVNRRWLVGWFC